MNNVALPLQELCQTAIAAATKAGEYIQSVDRGALQKTFKAAGNSAASQIVTEVDIRSEAIIRECLLPWSEQWNIAFVGEESSRPGAGSTPERFIKPWFWCVDPLDGTLPFAEGRCGYAVSIGLVRQSGEPLLGVVYDPAAGMVLHAIEGQGAYKNASALTPRQAAASELVVYADASFEHHQRHQETIGVLDACAKQLGLKDIAVVYGSGAVKNACQVLEHPSACYLKLPKVENGGGSIWDFAASACIARESGCWATNIAGDSLELNRQGSTFMNHQGVIYASNAEIGRFLSRAF